MRNETQLNSFINSSFDTFSGLTFRQLLHCHVHNIRLPSKLVFYGESYALHFLSVFLSSLGYDVSSVPSLSLGTFLSFMKSDNQILISSSLSFFTYQSLPSSHNVIYLFINDSKFTTEPFHPIPKDVLSLVSRPLEKDRTFTCTNSSSGVLKRSVAHPHSVANSCNRSGGDPLLAFKFYKTMATSCGMQHIKQKEFLELIDCGK
jgi:hypothetical protein